MLTPDLAADAQSRLLSRIATTAVEMDGKFPQAADPQTGRWQHRPEGAWTDGFWPALCFLAYETTGEARYRDWGLEAALRLRSREDTQTHDIGFLFYYGAVLGWRATGDPRLRDLALRAADRLAAMAHPRARAITVGAHAEVSAGDDDVTIDCMMNLQLLWWAATQTGDARYREVAVAHAERTAAWHPRPDGSCYQSVHFDPATGEAHTKHTHQGWSADGCWSRGLGWCCYGFLEAYAATGREDFLDVSRRAFEYHLRHAPSDGVTFNDYCDPRVPDAPRDTSAAAILASASLGLAVADPSRADVFQTEASRILEGLVGGYLTPLDTEDVRPPGMLLHGCYNERKGDAADHELIWGDYYLLEALGRWQRSASRRSART